MVVHLHCFTHIRRCSIWVTFFNAFEHSGFTEGPERSRRASILCRSLRFRVSQKGLIKLCVNGREWPCQWVESAAKVLHCNLNQPEVTARVV